MRLPSRSANIATHNAAIRTEGTDKISVRRMNATGGEKTGLYLHLSLGRAQESQMPRCYDSSRLLSQKSLLGKHMRSTRAKEI